MLTDEYVKRVYAKVEERDPDQTEFLQAVQEVFESIEPVFAKHPEYEAAGVLQRFVEPERLVKFRVAWVDDNFVTLWGDAPEQEEACLALLNSTWSKCYLECLCTVMGGGALKVETSHICKLQFPAFSPRQLGRLAACGRKIIATKAMSGSLQAEIDAAVLEPFQEPEQILAKLRVLLLRRLSERGAKL